MADTWKVHLRPESAARPHRQRGLRLTICIIAKLALSSLLGAVPAEERLSNLSIHRWGAESGLPEETFAAMLAPGDGYVWLASNHGLVRFDGQRAQVFRIGDSFRASGTGPCSSNTLSTLLLSSDGAIWTGASSGCVFRILRDRFGSFANFRLQANTAPNPNRNNNGVMALRNLPGGKQVEIHRRSSIASVIGASESGQNSNQPAPPLAELSAISAAPGLQILFSARDSQNRLWAVMSDSKLYSSEGASAGWVMHFEIPANPRACWWITMVMSGLPPPTASSVGAMGRPGTGV